MTTTWYKATLAFGGEVTPVEVDRETRTMVSVLHPNHVQPSIERKSDDFTSYFPTKDQAIDWLIAGQETEVAKYRRRYHEASETLAKMYSKFGRTPAV